jgi:hypothetical protein
MEAGKPLPDKYRLLLFDDKREVELVWNGKTNEVCNVVLPAGCVMPERFLVTSRQISNPPNGKRVMRPSRRGQGTSITAPPET